MHHSYRVQVMWHLDDGMRSVEVYVVFLNGLSRGLAPKESIDLLLDPRLVVGGVGVGRSLVDKAAEVCQLINEVEQLRDVVGDGGDVGVHPLEVLLIDLADPLQALVDRL